MKKISLFLVTLCALLGFSSCEDEKKPVFLEATSDSFEVYESAFQDQYYELTEKGTLEIVAKSAPNYGAPIGPTKYGALVSLTPDFNEYKEIKAENNASRIMLRTEDISIAICQLMGLTKEDAGYVFNEPIKIYLKATCQVEQIANSKVVSKNYCTFNKIMPYFAIPTPAFIYLVGAPEGWVGPSVSAADHYETWKLFEKDEEIGSKVFYGTFEIPEGSAMFRFYTALTGWDADSYGSQADDNPIEFDWAGEGAFTAPIVKGKGSFSFPGWKGGKMTIKVSMSGTPTLEIVKAE